MSNDSVNLVPNASFEELADSLPIGWQSGAARPELAPARCVDSTVARSGRYSLCLSGVGAAGVTGWVSADFRYLWRKERRPACYQPLTRRDQ